MTTGKKILIGVSVGIGVWSVFFLKGLDGQTLWQRKFGSQPEPKEPKKSNADGDSSSCGCSKNNSSERTFNQGKGKDKDLFKK